MPAIRSPLRPAIRSPLRSPLAPALGGSPSLTAQVQALFAGGKVGGMWDMGDTSTLFQDYATPVTAVTQPIGIVLDKSQGLILGSELVTNGDFSGGTTGWVPRAGAATHAVVGGEMEVTAINTSAQVTEQSFSVVSGRTYKVTGTMRAAGTNSVANSARISILGASVFSLAQVSANGVQTPFSLFATANSSTFQVQLSVASLGAWGAIGDKAYFDNISIKEIPGNHATQPTAGSRPLFSARKNLLVKTEQLDDGGLNSGIWKRSYADVVVTPNQGSGGFSDLDRIENSVGSGEDQGVYQATAVAAANKTFTAQVTLAAVSGTTTAFLLIGDYDGGDVGNSAVVSLTTTPTTFTVSHTFGAGAVDNCYLEIAPNVVGVPILAGRAQIERNSVATSYQRVNTASDYDTVGFPAFAQFDATDDALLFPAITFGGAFNTFVAGKVTGGTQGVHLWRTADVNGTWAKYKSGDATTPTGTGSGSPTYAVNGPALSPSQQGQLYTQINGVDSVVESIGVVLTAETALQLSGFVGSLFTGNAHRVLMISGTLTAGEKLLCRQWAAEGNGVTVV